MRKKKSSQANKKQTSPGDSAVRRIEGRSDASFARFAVVATQWYDEVLDPMIAGALQVLREAGAQDKDVTVIRVPGAFELPLALEHAAASGRYDALVALGCVIRGGTPHFEYVAGECTRGIGEVALSYRLPIAFGVLTTDTLKQARDRSRPGKDNKGCEAALAAVHMLSVLRQLHD